MNCHICGQKKYRFSKCKDFIKASINVCSECAIIRKREFKEWLESEQIKRAALKIVERNRAIALKKRMKIEAQCNECGKWFNKEKMFRGKGRIFHYHNPIDWSYKHFGYFCKDCHEEKKKIMAINTQVMRRLRKDLSTPIINSNSEIFELEKTLLFIEQKLK